MHRGLFVLNKKSFGSIYGPAERKAIHQLLHIPPLPYSREEIALCPELLMDIEVLVSGWGAPKLDAAFLEAAPRLQAVFYGAGSIKAIVTDCFWDKAIPITSAYAANAVPVAEFTFSQIILCLKRVWYYAQAVRKEHTFPERQHTPGAFQTNIGLISLGMIGRRVAEFLKLLDVNVLAYDPYLTDQIAAELGVRLCSLDEIFHCSDVVSLHTPWLPETENLIRGHHFLSMKPNASFINTARGAVVCEPELIDALTVRQDIQAVLDVTHPEPPAPESPLYRLPNVMLTPHIAGSVQDECRRMGQYMVEELRRYLSGEPLEWAIDRECAALLA